MTEIPDEPLQDAFKRYESLLDPALLPVPPPAVTTTVDPAARELAMQLFGPGWAALGAVLTCVEMLAVRLDPELDTSVIYSKSPVSCGLHPESSAAAIAAEIGGLLGLVQDALADLGTETAVARLARDD